MPSVLKNSSNGKKIVGEKISKLERIFPIYREVYAGELFSEVYAYTGF